MNQNHEITIDQEVELMNTQMKESPKLLQKSAGKESCCIFRVPKSLAEMNKKACQPEIVSIGPYHHENKDLEMIEEHKWRYLNDLIQRTGKPLVFFMKIIVSLVDEIRQSYSESTDHISTNDLAKMMVLDGFFLIELFRKVGELVPTDHDDPIFNMVWVSPSLMRDLLRMENQIPFFVLQKLFDESKTDNRTLPSLILEFFNYGVKRPNEVLNKHEELKGKHLLDFIRKSFIKSEGRSPNIVPRAKDTLRNHHPLKFIQPATKLIISSGVQFEGSDAASFLDIELQKRVLLIPQINMGDFYTSFLLNCVAFEQCYHHCSKHFTNYVVFMGSLIHTSNDVDLLSKGKIFDNYFCTDEEIVNFFKNISKVVASDNKNNYFKDLYVEVNGNWDGLAAGVNEIKSAYKCPSLLASVSVFAAFLLLSLAALQTIYTVYPYYHHN